MWERVRKRDYDIGLTYSKLMELWLLVGKGNMQEVLEYLQFILEWNEVGRWLFDGTFSNSNVIAGDRNEQM